MAVAVVRGCEIRAREGSEQRRVLQKKEKCGEKQERKKKDNSR